MGYILNINTSELVKFTNKLEKIGKHELPIAIRGTLNKAAFNVKQVTMPESAEGTFEKRHPNFFKANSRVQMATGLEMASMKSIVGFTSSNLRYNNKAVHELQAQEYGGEIRNRDLIPTDSSRTGNNNSTAVRPKNRLRSIGRIENKAIKAASQTGPSRRFKFVKAAIKAGRGGYVIAGLRKTMLYRIDSISRKFGRTFIKQTAIYSYRAGRDVNIKQTKFMRNATLTSAKNLNKYFIEEAGRRISKMMMKR